MSGSELVCLAVAQAMLGFNAEAPLWLRFARLNLGAMFPCLPGRSGYNKRLRAALPWVRRAIRLLAADTDFWFDNHWIVGSTLVPCEMSRQTVKRSRMVGWAGYGYCACIWPARPPECRSRGHWRIRRSTSARSWPRYWTANRSWLQHGRACW